jgi:hypothetical protein
LAGAFCQLGDNACFAIHSLGYWSPKFRICLGNYRWISIFTKKDMGFFDGNI